MKFQLQSFALLLVASFSQAFTPPLLIRSSTTTTTTQLFAEGEEEAEKVAKVNRAPVEAGSHEELMYALGVNLARQLGDIRPLVENGDELAQVAKGLLDTVIGRLEEDGQRALLASRGKDLNDLISSRANNLRKELEEEGKNMLEQMAETEGTEKLDSGVIVHILEPNPDGPKPTRSSTVKVHYHGTLPDGTVFDSTLAAEPIDFPLAGVIPGWSEGLLKMREGETAMLGIPPEQAYGEEGTPDGRIPGGSTLFFKVQLLKILTAGIGGAPTLLGADGKKLGGDADEDAPKLIL